MSRPTEAYIGGVGMTHFGKWPEVPLRAMSSEAVSASLADAGVSAADVEVAFFANSLGGLLVGQEALRGEVCLHDAGIFGIPIVNVENACAGGATALWSAVRAVRSGEFRVALAVGAEKMFVGDTQRTLAALQTAADVATTQGQGLQFVALYAMRLQQRLDAGLLTKEHLALVTRKGKANGVENEYAQFRTAMTDAEILGGRVIAGPLTLPMVSGISDGAAAVVVIGRPSGSSGVCVTASVLSSGSVDGLGETVVGTTIRRAYLEAGVGPEDLDVAEVHDAVSPAELFRYEELGLCGTGEAGALLESGATAVGGRIPVNPSGGLTARGHPVAATGLAQIAELTWQLTGRAGRRQVDGCRVALAQNSGGWIDGDTGAGSVHILQNRSGE
ncbi:MAG TPA: thiolase family protein [Candidatus Dormibacteraeota bacterium]